MKESNLYLIFFKSNLVLITVCALVLSFVGYFYQTRKPTVYTENLFLQMAYSEGDINQKIALADQAVTLGRSENIKKDLGVSANTEINLFKPGPLAIQVSASSIDRSTLDSDLSTVFYFLKNNFPLAEMGQRVYFQSSANKALGILIGFVIGTTLGIWVSLVKTYLKNY